MPQKNECSNIKNLKGFLLFILLSLSTFFLTNEIYAADDFKSIMQLIEKGEKEKAAQQIDQYLKTNPNDPQVIFIKGVVNAELGKYNEAIQAFTYLTEKHPSLPEPFNNLAVLYAELGDYDKAQKALESAIKTHPSYATAHVNLGDLYTKRATVAYNKALEIDKTNVQAKTKLSLIKKRRMRTRFVFLVSTCPFKVEEEENEVEVATEKDQKLVTIKEALESFKVVFDFFESQCVENEKFEADLDNLASVKISLEKLKESSIKQSKIDSYFNYK